MNFPVFSRSPFSALRLYAAIVALVLFASAARSTTVIPPSFNSLVGQADYIVRAVVKSVSSEMVTDAGGRHIITKVKLDVRQVISGNPPQPLVLQMLGGKVGNEQMIVEGAPSFEVGDENILFVHGNGTQFNPLVALMHGSYPILADSTGRQFVARSNGRPLYNEQEVALPMGATSPLKASQPQALPLSPADFISRIQAVAPKNSRPNLAN